MQESSVVMKTRLLHRAQMPWRRQQVSWIAITTVFIASITNVTIGDRSPDYRLKRCLAYRTLAFQGNYPDWIPYHDVVDPCSLRCRDADRGTTVLLESVVPDGTNCHNRTEHDACWNGICLSLGCDGRWGSGRKLDDCGICGGNGTTCRGSTSGSVPVSSTSPRSSQTDSVSGSPDFEWNQTNFSDCSVSCGVGVQERLIECRRKTTFEIVKDEFCDAKTRPERRLRSCQVDCQHVWIAGSWSHCTRSCGGGLTRRQFYCVAALDDGSFEKVSEDSCDQRKPEATKSCNQVECPQWIAGQWSTCSRTCSVGIQQRPVACRRSVELDCSANEKPISRRICNTKISCNRPEVVGEEVMVDLGGRSSSGSNGAHELQGRMNYDRSQLDERELSDAGWTEHDGTNPRKEFESSQSGQRRGHRRGGIKRRSKYAPVGWGLSSVHVTGTRTDGISSGPVLKNLESTPPSHSLARGLIEGRGDFLKSTYVVDEGPRMELKSGSVGDNREVSTIPSFVVSSWGPCSATCGMGIRLRRVHCQVFDKITKVVIDLQETACSGQKPAEAEYCSTRECFDEAVHQQFAWTFTSYGPCSRSCAGGLQEAVYSCLRVSNYTIVKNDNCKHLATPFKPPQRCNEHRCPPRWRAFPYGPCSASCGGGRQPRHVTCIHDLENGAREEVPDYRCSLPKPDVTIFCNMAPCAPGWNVDSWSKCSVTCGQGIQKRQVRCEQKISLATVATINESHCAELSPKPATAQQCSDTHVACPNATSERKKAIASERSLYIQLKPLPSQVVLVVGGSAVLIPGTTVQITCPVRLFNKSQIVWSHGGKDVGKNGRVKVLPKGILRIRNSRDSDSGVYKCIAGRDSAVTNVTFHSLLAAQRLEQEKMPYSSHSERITEQGRLSDDQEEQKYPTAMKNLLRKYNMSELPLHFNPHPWSACSKTCGGGGLQSRDITCEITMDKYTLVVGDGFCLKKGLKKPIETRDCGFESLYLTCPSWEVGTWTECTDESCLRVGFGSRRRPVNCLASNGTSLDDSRCSQESKPIGDEKCPHENCQAAWTTSNWTKCSVSCGGKGTISRILECVWTSNGKPAGSECEGLAKPETIQPCQAPVCSEPVCRDESKYCSLIPKLHMCRYPQYKFECCFSCNHFSNQQQQTQQLRSRRHFYHHHPGV